MKRLIIQIFSLFLVTAILINTAGITVFYHFCKEEGIASLSFSQDDNCCGEKAHVKKTVKENHACCKKKQAGKFQLVKKNDGCCSKDTFTAQWKINEFSVSKKIIFLNSAVIIPLVFPALSIRYPAKHDSAFFRSPPLFSSSRDILNTTSVLLI